MRHHRLRARARAAVVAAALTSAAFGLAAGAAAQERYDRLFIFGDSYADLTLANPAVTGQPGLSLWNVYPVSLGSNLKIPTLVDFAVGGATASPGGTPALPPFWNLPQQVDNFIAGGGSISSRDLVTLNIGANDLRTILLLNSAAINQALGYPNATINPINAKSFADVTTKLVSDQIDRLVNAGAQNFVLGGFSTFANLPELQAVLATLPPAIADAAAKSADGFAKAYFEGMQTALLPQAQDGKRFFLFDLGRLATAVNDDPGKYGFAGFMCTNPPACGFDSQFYFGPDGLHLTNAGFDLVGRYMANIVEAPSTISVQPGVVSATTSGFVQSMLGRLDASRVAREAGRGAAGGSDGVMGLGHGKATAPETGTGSGLTAYAMGAALGGDRSDLGYLSGYEYESKSGTIGIEYSLTRNLILGIAGNTTSTDADLTNGAGINVDAVQGAAYLSYATRYAFAEALVAYASADVDLSRDGVIDRVRSSTGATSLAAAARGGYLFDFGGLRAGPIAGVTFVHSRVDGYTERGDPLLTYKVSSQTLDSLAGNLGIRLMAPFQVGGNTVVPYLNILLEHQFGDHSRSLSASLTQAPLLPILTPVTDFDQRTYGKLEGGVTFQITPEVSATVNGATAFDGDGVRDYNVGVGLSYRF